jgi:hypothetical protein
VKFNVQGATVGGFEKTEGEREAERRWRVTRLYRVEQRWAEVHFEAESKKLVFVLMQGARDGAHAIYVVPLLSFEAFQLDTDEHWFGDIGGRELAQEMRRGSAWVIIAEADGHGVLLIARSGRDRASMAHLHQILRNEFIGRRREWLAKAEELASKS